MGAAETEVRSKTAEAILEPLFRKLSSFANFSVRHPAKRPRSKSQAAIVSAVNEFLKDIEFRANILIKAFPPLESEINIAISDVLDTGRIFETDVVAFTGDPIDNSKSVELKRSGSALLSALCRLLILTEVADVSLLHQLLRSIHERIEYVINTPSSRKLLTEWRELERELSALISLIDKRSPDVLNREHQDRLNRARFILKNTGPLLYTASRVCLHHPDHVAAQNARDFVVKLLDNANSLIQSTIDSDPKPGTIRLKIAGKLLQEIEEFENSTLMDPQQFDDKRARSEMERHLKRLLPSVYHLADAKQTRPAARQHVYTQCKRIQRGLEDLLNEYNRKPLDRAALQTAMQALLNTTCGLKQLLLRIAVDHVTQALMNKDQPLMALSDATKFGSEHRMDSACQSFQEHSADLISAAYEMCGLTSSNEELSKSIQLSCSQMEQLRPQVVNTGYLLFKFPYSKSIEANFEAFKQSYQQAANLLATTLSELTSVHDFLAVADDQMREDYQKSIQALAEKNESGVQHTAGSMQRRSAHVCDVVVQKLSDQTDNLDYVEHVMESVTLLRDEYTATFTETARDTLSRLAARQRVDESCYRQAGANLCSAVHEVRLAALNESNLPSELEALRLKDAGDVDSDKHSVDGASIKLGSPDRRSSQRDISASGSVSQENRHSERTELYAMLTAPERETMAQELAGFLEEKKRFMREVVQWDDSANEIIVLAKKMCVIMMDMTDYTRGKGPLNSTMEVIQAAQNISEYGQRLDRLCRDIANLCPDSASRRDLLAYLQRVTLHCHQLNITSRVKAGVQAARSEVVENAAALIQAARNLMTAVVLTVKESYIASTKYRSPEQQNRPVVRWQMRAPAKKPLITPDGPELAIHDDDDAEWYTGSFRNPHSDDALIELAQFDHPHSPPSSHYTGR